MAEAEKRLFVWVIHLQPWAEPRPTPQIIHDVGMFEYKQIQLHNRGMEEIIFRRELTDAEYGLSLRELVKRYPYLGAA